MVFIIEFGLPIRQQERRVYKNYLILSIQKYFQKNFLRNEAAFLVKQIVFILSTFQFKLQANLGKKEYTKTLSVSSDEYLSLGHMGSLVSSENKTTSGNPDSLNIRSISKIN